MIFDSVVYKEELGSELADIEKVVSKAVTSETFDQVGMRVERFTFWMAFVTRKLSEANKLSDELEGTSVKVRRFARTDDRPQDFLNLHRLDEFYDLTNGEAQNKSVAWLGSQLIHSYVFATRLDDDDQIDGLFFNSDQSREDSLWLIKWSEVTRIASLVAEDNIAWMVFDRESGKTRKSRTPMPADHPLPEGTSHVIPDDPSELGEAS